MNLFALSGLLSFDEIERLSRQRIAVRREEEVSGCSRAGNGVTRNALRAVLEPYDVSASRRGKLHGHRAGRGVLRDRRRHATTVGGKHIAPAPEVEFAGEVVRGDRLSDRKGVGPACSHRDLHPVEEHTGGDVLVDRRVAGVIHLAEGRGRAVVEL